MASMLLLLLFSRTILVYSSLASFPDYSPLQIPQLTLSKLYSNATLPTYAINLHKINTTMIFLSSLEFKCNQDLTNLLDNRNIFSSQNQLWICFAQINLVYCDIAWSEVTDCGTFIEIHHPYDQEVIDQRQVSYYDELEPIGMPLQKLCAGNYHIWLVIRSRMGRIIARVAPLYIFYPSCA